MGSQYNSNKKKSSSLFPIILVTILLALIVFGVLIFFEGEKPVITLDNDVVFLSGDSEFSLTAKDEKKGLRSLKVTIKQDTNVKELLNSTFPRQGFTGQVGPGEDKATIRFIPKEGGFKNGAAVLTFEAADYSLRGLLSGNKTVVEKQVTIDTKPPKINILHSERYIFPGGTGIVLYRLSPDAIEHGLTVGDAFHPGFPLADSKENTYIAYFGLPYNVSTLKNSFVTAKDQAGNIAKTPFSSTVKKPNFRQDRINVGDGFLNKKIPEFEQSYPDLAGTTVEKYITVNNKVRQLNNQQIFDICQNPHQEKLWHGSFLRMAGSSRAKFADHRTYYYGGKKIDRQVHLGMDIASTSRVEVKAANAGKVAFADYLGIYGNMVILDHGQGVFSLYSHLSQIDVAVDDMIEKNVVIGRTGVSGMAGGDHLHFSMLINGIFVTPVEWWDQHWIDVTISDPITSIKF